MPLNMVEAAPSGITIRETRLDGPTFEEVLHGLQNIREFSTVVFPTTRHFGSIDIVDTRIDGDKLKHSLAIGRDGYTVVLIRDGKEIHEESTADGLEVAATSEDFSKILLVKKGAYTGNLLEARFFDNGAQHTLISNRENTVYHNNVSSIDEGRFVFSFSYGDNTEIRAFPVVNPDEDEFVIANGRYSDIKVLAYAPDADDPRIYWCGTRGGSVLYETFFDWTMPIVKGRIDLAEVSADAKHYLVVAEEFSGKKHGIFSRIEVPISKGFKVIYDGREIVSGEFKVGKSMFTPSLNVVAVETICNDRHKLVAARSDRSVDTSNAFNAIVGEPDISDHAIVVTVDQDNKQSSLTIR